MSDSSQSSRERAAGSARAFVEALETLGYRDRPSPLTARWQRIKAAVSPLRRAATATSDPHPPDFAEPLAPVADWMRLPR